MRRLRWRDGRGHRRVAGVSQGAAAHGHRTLVWVYDSGACSRISGGVIQMARHTMPGGRLT